MIMIFIYFFIELFLDFVLKSHDYGSENGCKSGKKIYIEYLINYLEEQSVKI